MRNGGRSRVGAGGERGTGYLKPRERGEKLALQAPRAKGILKGNEKPVGTRPSPAFISAAQIIFLRRNPAEEQQLSLRRAAQTEPLNGHTGEREWREGLLQ